MSNHLLILEAYKIDVPSGAETEQMIKDIKTERQTFGLLEFLIRNSNPDDLVRESRKYGISVPLKPDQLREYILENILFYETVVLSQKFSLARILSSFNICDYLLTFSDQSLRSNFHDKYEFYPCRLRTIRTLVSKLDKERVIPLKSSPVKLRRNKAFYIEGKKYNKQEIDNMKESHMKEQVNLILKDAASRDRNYIYEFLNRP